MIGYTDQDLRFDEVLDSAIDQAELDLKKAQHMGASELVLKDLSAKVVHRKQLRINAMKCHNELNTAVDEGHPVLVLSSRKSADGLPQFTINSLYKYALTYGLDIPEWGPATDGENGPLHEGETLFLAICWFMDFVLIKVIADWKSMAADPDCDVTRSFMANGKPNPTGIFRLIEDKYRSEPSGDILTTAKQHIRWAVEFILNEWSGEMPFTTRRIPYAHRTLYGLLLTAHQKSGKEDPLPDPTTDLPGFIEAAHEILLPAELLSIDELASCLESCIRRRTNKWREPS